MITSLFFGVITFVFALWCRQLSISFEVLGKEVLRLKKELDDLRSQTTDDPYLASTGRLERLIREAS